MEKVNVNIKSMLSEKAQAYANEMDPLEVYHPYKSDKFICSLFGEDEHSDRFDTIEELAKAVNDYIEELIRCDISEQIKELRDMLGLTQKAFGEKYNIPKRTIENWESGERECPVYVLQWLDRAVKSYKKWSENWS